MTVTAMSTTLGQPIHARFPVRWSTVLMLVLFVGLGNLYLEVRSPPRATLPGSLVTSTTTTGPPTTAPADPTTTIEIVNDSSNAGNSGTSEAPSPTTTTSTPTPASTTTSTAPPTPGAATPTTSTPATP